MSKYARISCSCHGGITGVIYPSECRSCHGKGYLLVTPNDRVMRYPGRLDGRASDGTYEGAEEYVEIPTQQEIRAHA